MVEGVAALSAELAGDLPAPLRIGIGIHAGPAVVGRMGWGESFYLTAVGDTVHVAARLEQATKDYRPSWSSPTTSPATRISTSPASPPTTSQSTTAPTKSPSESSTKSSTSPSPRPANAEPGARETTMSMRPEEPERRSERADHLAAQEQARPRLVRERSLDPIRAPDRHASRARGGGWGWGRTGPVPVKYQRESSARMEPSRRGAANACRVVRSTPPPTPAPRSTEDWTSGRENTVIATVLSCRVHHPLHAVWIGARGKLAGRGEDEA